MSTLDRLAVAYLRAVVLVARSLGLPALVRWLARKISA